MDIKPVKWLSFMGWQIGVVINDELLEIGDIGPRDDDTRYVIGMYTPKREVFQFDPLELIEGMNMKVDFDGIISDGGYVHYPVKAIYAEIRKLESLPEKDENSWYVIPFNWKRR